jgi:acyl-CoA synthetase (AMP-forming)/AMP-acid ligase II
MGERSGAGLSIWSANVVELMCVAMTIHSPFSSLVEVVRHRAMHQANERAYVFISDSGTELAQLTFGELDSYSRSLARTLRMRGRTGDRALLIFPPGLEFIVAYLACLYAGIVAVPVVPPRRGRLRLATLSIAEDCQPTIGLTNDVFLSEVAKEFSGQAAWDAITWMSIGAARNSSCDRADGCTVAFDEVAFLQYTSGSTSAPKGVMVTHRNLVTNLEMIRRAFGTTSHSRFVSWMPLYHDMGLILNVLHTLYIGSLCVLMAPASFIQRPLAWLAAISKYGAEVAGGPNFGYDLCVKRFRPERAENLDLSSWRVAMNGAEPVRARTLQHFTETFSPYGFNQRTFYPCYGMAEGTLLLSGGARDALPVIRKVERNALTHGRVVPVNETAKAWCEVVGCGSELVGERLAVVDPETRCECASGQIGEIWVAGPHVTRGYWQNAAASDETFAGEIAATGEGPFLRTGDLGFLLDGELFISGRVKDIIVIRGQNYYPQDIEATVAACHPAFKANFGAAFAVDEEGEQRLVVVQEVERTWRFRPNAHDLVESVRKAVVAEHELMISEVVLIRTGTLPKTSSGKVRRRHTRQLYVDGNLELWRFDEARIDSSSGRA